MNTYEVLDLVQGSEAWLETRRKYVTASNVPVLFDQSPYKTKLQYFEEIITGKEPFVSDAKQTLFVIGHKAEIAGREYLEKEYGITIPPMVVISLSCPGLLASLDGFHEKLNLIFEVKYVGTDALHLIRKGKLPAHHLCQVQAQLLATGASKCIYFAMDPKGDSAIVEVLPDLDYHREIAIAVDKFMQDVRNGNEPEPSPRDFYCPDDTRFEQLKLLKERSDAALEAFDVYKKELLSLYTDYTRIKAGGLLVTRSIRKGNINYSKVPQLKGIDLEKYRSKTIETVTVRFDKNGSKNE